jgi:hypothetical protein
MPLSEASPQKIFLPCSGILSTPYVFLDTGFQNAANSVYVQKSTIDASNLARGKGAYTFKTNFERMQFLVGQAGTATRW